MTNPQWHLHVTNQVLPSLDSVIPAGCDVAFAFTGDYNLELVKQTSTQCCWEVVFPVMCDLSRVKPQVEQHRNGRFDMQVKMNGNVVGPLWSAKNIAEFTGLLNLSMHGKKHTQAFAGAMWPQSVTVEPVTTAMLQESFLHPGYTCTRAEPADDGCGVGSNFQWWKLSHCD